MVCGTGVRAPKFSKAALARAPGVAPDEDMEGLAEGTATVPPSCCHFLGRGRNTGEAGPDRQARQGRAFLLGFPEGSAEATLPACFKADGRAWGREESSWVPGRRQAS